MVCLATPSDRKYVPGVVATPVVEGSFPAVEFDMDLISVHGSDSGRAHEVRVLAIDGLQFHPGFELVRFRGRWLLRTNEIN